MEGELGHLWRTLYDAMRIQKSQEIIMSSSTSVNDPKVQKLAKEIDKTYLKVDIFEASNLFETGGGSLYRIYRHGGSITVDPTEGQNVFEAHVDKFMKEIFQWVPIRDQVLSKYRKNPEVSRSLRERGNSLYKSKNLEDAREFYSLSIVFAPTESQELGLAYANRSAVLFELGHAKEALEDIDLALKNEYPESLVSKLYQRQRKCEELIRSKLLAEVAMGLRAQVDFEKILRNEIRTSFLSVRNPNVLMPAAADFVELKFSEKFGRYLAVNRDVPPGTLLMAEDPFASLLLSGSNWDMNHCFHCFKRILRGIPCNGCVFAMFCSELCKSSAMPVHRYECKCLPSLHINTLPHETAVHMALRIVLKVGTEELFRIFSSKDPSFSELQTPFGTSPGVKYESDDYKTIYHLAHHFEKTTWHVRFKRVHEVAVLLWTLDSETDFFTGIPRERKTEFKYFVAAMMVRHVFCANVNSNEIDELTGLQKYSLEDYYSGGIPFEDLKQRFGDAGSFGVAVGLYPVFSLVSHSCDSNSHRVHDRAGGRLMIVSKRGLKKGEALTISYCGGFYHMPKARRQERLKSLYFIDCDCVACRNDWPLLEQMNKMEFIFTCPSCSKKFYAFQKGSDSAEFMKCVLEKDSGSWYCRLCSKRYDDSELTLLKDYSLAMTGRVENYLCCNHPRKAWGILLPLFDFFQYHLCPPQVQQMYNQSYVMYALTQIMYFSQ